MYYLQLYMPWHVQHIYFPSYPLRLNIYLQIPRQMSGFHMHAVIPMIQVVVNSIGQPQLCHTTLTFIREVLKL